jgi:hypothetical protein
MATHLQDVRLDFDWQPQPAAASVAIELVDRCIQANPQIATLAVRMRDETGTRLLDWVDWIEVTDEPELADALAKAGYLADANDATAWRHPLGIFPAIRLLEPTSPIGNATAGSPMLAVKVGSVDDFVAAMGDGMSAEVRGEPGSQFRVCVLSNPDGATLLAVERHGWRGFNSPGNRAQQIAAAAKHRQSFGQRRREFENPVEGFRLVATLFDAAAADLGRDWACDLFFAAEREYWMSRNAAARVQYARQQRLGLGWGNHDHHTYRSGRECFAMLIEILERMGFECRERFYAGREAGWGAQVIEQSAAGIVIFADVDLTPQEVAGDFAHTPLEPLEKLGTVGLWCMLHGEAFLEAGMHHLECQFDFDAVREQLAGEGIITMTPFTDWAHLKQAFTRGEIWPVRPERIEEMLSGNFINEDQAEQFRREGALGSHLEILERNDGFKGFNQTGISEIITRTDPRKW